MFYPFIFTVWPGPAQIHHPNSQQIQHRPWGNWTHFVSTDLAPVVHGDDFIVAGVNTARRWATLFDQNRGRISTSQIGCLINHLKTSPDTHLRILVAHHPFWLPAEQMRRHLIGGRDKALATLR